MQQFKRPTYIDATTPEGLAKARGWDINTTKVECFGNTYQGNPPQVVKGDNR